LHRFLDLEPSRPVARFLDLLISATNELQLLIWRLSHASHTVLEKRHIQIGIRRDFPQTVGPLSEHDIVDVMTMVPENRVCHSFARGSTAESTSHPLTYLFDLTSIDGEGFANTTQAQGSIQLMYIYDKPIIWLRRGANQVRDGNTELTIF
jgi:hypothetical protein